MSRTAVYGILRDRRHVEGLVDSLRHEGFRSRDISVLLAPIANEDAALSQGGAFNWPVAITALASPGVGPLIGAGPIMNTFGLDRVENRVVGSLVRKLAGIGVAENHARRYDFRIKSGGLLFSVLCSNSVGAQRAKRLLEQRGAEEIWSQFL